MPAEPAFEGGARVRRRNRATVETDRPALKMFIADRTNKVELQALVDGIRSDAAEALGQLGAQAATASAYPERMPTNVLSRRLVADVHAALMNWRDWAAGAVATLERGDEAAIERQTRAALAFIASAAGRSGLTA